MQSCNDIERAAPGMIASGRLLSNASCAAAARTARKAERIQHEDFMVRDFAGFARVRQT